MKILNQLPDRSTGIAETVNNVDNVGYRAAARLFTRRQPVTVSMVALALIIPLYLFIGGALIPGRTVYAPAIWLDLELPVQPSWSVIYLSLFLAALLPVFVVHQQELVRRTVNAFLAIWLVAYVFFLVYPTIGPRPMAKVLGDDFSSWLLQSIYSSDFRYNCLPSLHVAQCVLAALVCAQVHRGVGAAAGLWAGMVGVSTVYTKQHYILDVVTGALLAYLAYRVFLRGYAREATPEVERRLAPLLALGAVGTYGIIVGIMWIAYKNGVTIS